MISLSILYQIEARKKLHLLVLNSNGYEDLLMSNLRDFQKFSTFFDVEKQSVSNSNMKYDIFLRYFYMIR